MGSRIPQLGFEAMRSLVVPLLSVAAQDDRLAALLGRMLGLSFDAPNVHVARVDLAGALLLQCSANLTRDLETACFSVVTADASNAFPEVRERALGVLSLVRQTAAEWETKTCPLLCDVLVANLQRASQIDVNEAELRRAMASASSLIALLGNELAVLVDASAGSVLAQFILILQIDHSWDKRPRVVVVDELGGRASLAFARFGSADTLAAVHECLRGLASAVPDAVDVLADLLFQVLDAEGDVDCEALAGVGRDDSAQALLILGQLALGHPASADGLLSAILALPVWAAAAHEGGGDGRTPRDLALRASMKQCALMAVADCAQAMGQAFRGRLVSALFPVLQSRSDDHAGVVSSAEQALASMARF